MQNRPDFWSACSYKQIEHINLILFKKIIYVYIINRKKSNGKGREHRVCYMDIKKFLGLMRWRIRFFFTIFIFPSRYICPYR